MSKLAFWDTETNGLLREATKMHCVGAKIDGVWYAGFHGGGHMGKPSLASITLPSGVVLHDVRHGSVEYVLGKIAEADLRVAHNGNDFDERVTRKLYPDWNPQGTELDTLLISRLVYPMIGQQGPNSHKCPPGLRTRHSLEAWGYRLGEKKNKDFDAGDWQTFSWDMLTYMLQDVVVLEKLFLWLMSRKPSPRAVEVEHKFASIMRRQEAWGFGFDHEAALALEADLVEESRILEQELIAEYGSWWAPGKETKVKATRRVAMPFCGEVQNADVTLERTSEKTGKPLKPYIGPPLCIYYEKAKYTPVTWCEFQPSSRDHVRLMLFKRHGWVPKVYTKKGTPKVDDDVLRALPFPEAPKIADLFQAEKIAGYVSKGKNAWLKTCRESTHNPGHWRQHGRVNTIGAYTFRCSHSNPNLAQVPTRSPKYGHRCRSLFLARPGFRVAGFDGSGMQLRLMAHHMAKYDGGRYAQVFIDGIDPHEFMRDAIGTDIMGEGAEGRSHGKTIDYALPFGGGELRLGSIVAPTAPEKRRREIGLLIKDRLEPTFGAGFQKLKDALADEVENKGYLVGLDGRRAYCSKPHMALSTLLQMGEAIIMRNALVICDEELQSRGLRCGVDAAGIEHVEDADYEFCANVHDEAQADVRPNVIETYREVALWCVAEAGRRFDLKCPLASDFKDGPDWSYTH